METGSPLPDGALMSGYLSDGTPLYTARFLVNTLLIYGYYNPENDMAHGEEQGVRVSTTFDIW